MSQNHNLAALSASIPDEHAQLEAASARLLQMVGERHTGFPHMTLEDAREIARVSEAIFNPLLAEPQIMATFPVGLGGMVCLDGVVEIREFRRWLGD